MTIDDAASYFCNLEYEYVMEILNEWQANKGNKRARQYWKVIPANLLVSIYNYYNKTGLVRDKQIDKIQESLVENCMKLYINSVLFGHTQYDPYSIFEYAIPEEMTESEFEELLEDFEWFACDNLGNWRISDYAIDKLNTLIIELIAEEDYTKKLYWIDRILNVAHQRSDLASWFVENGSATLSKISE